jgi:hypothetical protein
LHQTGPLEQSGKNHFALVAVIRFPGPQGGLLAPLGGRQASFAGIGKRAGRSKKLHRGVPAGSLMAENIGFSLIGGLIELYEQVWHPGSIVCLCRFYISLREPESIPISPAGGPERAIHSF